MLDLCFYFVLAAQNKDVDDWVNILFVVILAFSWVIGGLLKSWQAKKTGSNKSKQPHPDFPRKPVQFKMQERIKQIPEKAPTKFDNEHSQRPTSNQNKPIHSRESFHMNDNSFYQPVSGTTVPEIVPVKSYDEPIIDLSEHDSLIKAIIYREIFGPPLGLRDISESTVYFF